MEMLILNANIYKWLGNQVFNIIVCIFGFICYTNML